MSAKNIAIEAELRDRIADLEAIVIRLGGVGELPIEGEKSAVLRMQQKINELERRNSA